MLQSSRMVLSRYRRAGMLLLVFWVTADVAAYGFCGPSVVRVSTGSAHIETDSDSDAPAPVCRTHHCFCCSNSTEVVSFHLAHEARAVFVSPTLQPRPADISLGTLSPPPRS